MTPKEQYKEVKEICKNTKIPRNKELALLKLKEALQIESCDINEETPGINEKYDIHYRDILVYITIDYYYQQLVLAPYYDVLDEYDNIIDCCKA